MTELPTCFYCPECGSIERHHYTWAHTAGPLHPEWIDCGHKQVEFPVFPPGTPLTDVLDALGIPYRASAEPVYPDGDMGRFPSHKPVLVVDIDPNTYEFRKEAADRIDALEAALREIAGVAENPKTLYVARAWFASVAREALGEAHDG